MLYYLSVEERQRGRQRGDNQTEWDAYWGWMEMWRWHNRGRMQIGSEMVFLLALLLHIHQIAPVSRVSELDEMWRFRAVTLWKPIWKQSCKTLTHSTCRVAFKHPQGKTYKYLSQQSLTECERRRTLPCVRLHTVCPCLIRLITVVNYTGFVVHLSTGLMLNTCRLSDAPPLETLMAADRWESSRSRYNLPYLLAATWRRRDSRSHAIAQFV